MFVDSKERFDSGSDIDYDRLHSVAGMDLQQIPIAFNALYSGIISCINVISYGINLNVDSWDKLQVVQIWKGIFKKCIFSQAIRVCLSIFIFTFF